LNPHITQYSNTLREIICNHLTHHKSNSNLTKPERIALKNLQHNQDIIIKKADKSAGIVILNKQDYEDKIYSMLNDTNVYTRTDINDTLEVKHTLDCFAKQLYEAHYINKKQLRHITNFIPKCPIFYGIPKIHKLNNPLRPIVSQINGPTSKISKYLDLLLSTAEKQIPHLLQDTTAFLKLIEENKHTHNNTILVTLDVISLYTNIPQIEGADLVTQFYTDTIQLWNNSSISPIAPELLHKLILFVLQNTTFEFNNQYFTQNYGTTMGSNFSVKFANIYMYMFLQRFLQSYTGPIPNFFARLVDDIFFLWHHPEPALHELLHTLNNHHSSIKFEMNYSYTDINFLDTIVYVNSNTDTLHTKLYIKPTYKNQYLHYNSEHPAHIKSSIPYSQAIRLRRIIDDDNILHEEITNLKKRFQQRNYPAILLDRELGKINLIERSNTLIYKTDQQKKENFAKFLKGSSFLPLIIPFNSAFNKKPKLYEQIKHSWLDFLTKHEDIKVIFEGSIPQIIFSRGTTIQNSLITTKYSSFTLTDLNNIKTLQALENETNLTVNKCHHSRCDCCNFIRCSSTFASTITGQEFHINTSMNCNSYNIIYLITCNKCYKQYVGETSRKLKDRLNDHKSNISTNKKTAIAIHFHTVPHKLKHLSIIPIEQLTNNNKENRLEKEKYWIKALKTSYPFGLNYYPIDK